MNEKENIILNEPIPELIFFSGQEVHYELSPFFKGVDEGPLTFHIEDFPEGLTIDELTGSISGTAPTLPVDKPYLVSVTVTHQPSEQSITEYFAILIRGAHINLMADELNQGFVSAMKSNLSQIENWRLLKYIEYIISQHFPVVYIYDAFNAPNGFGQLLEHRRLNSGFSSFSFDNLLVITSGEMAFAEYGNSARLLKSLKEVYITELPKRNWSGVGLSSTDLITLNKAWIVASLLELPVSEEAPSERALASLRNLKNLVGHVSEPALRLVI